MWFIYLNYYLLYVVQLSPSATGAALLSGQVTDGITTPIVGIGSDKLNCAPGKRNTWYFFGTLLVLPSFTGIFISTPSFLSTESAKNIWYCVLPAVFNVGWASVQIAHMSVVNQLSYSQRRRDRMVNNRNGFTYVANICVLSVSLVLFIVFANGATSFTILCLMCISVGSLSSLFYTLNIKEPSLTKKALEMEAAYRKSLMQPLEIEPARINPTNNEETVVDGEIKESVLDDQIASEVKKQTASQW
jgi:Na+/melibiose symporter-like transporter